MPFLNFNDSRIISEKLIIRQCKVRCFIILLPKLAPKRTLTANNRNPQQIFKKYIYH